MAKSVIILMLCSHSGQSVLILLHYILIHLCLTVTEIRIILMRQMDSITPYIFKFQINPDFFLIINLAYQV